MVQAQSDEIFLRDQCLLLSGMGQLILDELVGASRVSPNFRSKITPNPITGREHDDFTLTPKVFTLPPTIPEIKTFR